MGKELIMTVYMEFMIDFIKNYQYYADGVLENMTEQQVKEIYDSIIDWIG
jgi:hypothetical protein